MIFTTRISHHCFGEHSVDEFIFGTKQGLCEHYSQAMTVMLRSVGIPARVVTGLHGGTINPYEDYIMVREKDAHAWVEAWIDDLGWQRFDPTFAVAPSRIISQDFLNDLFSLGADNSDLVGAQNGINQAWQTQRQGFNLLQKMQYRFDQLNYTWQRQVLNFNQRKQAEFLNKILGRQSYLRLALFIIGVFVLVFVSFHITQILLYKKSVQSNVSKETKAYFKLVMQLNKFGIPTSKSIPPMTLLDQVELSERRADLTDHEFELIKSAIHSYNQLQYASKQAPQKRGFVARAKAIC